MRRLALLLALAAACDCGKGRTGHDPGSDGGGVKGDASSPKDSGPVDSGLVPCGSSDCFPPQVCRLGQCVDPPTSCTGDADCQNDTHCVNGECLAWDLTPDAGSNPQCRR